MARTPITCVMGMHSYVREHPTGERLQGPPAEICESCGKRRGSPLDVPPGFMAGGV
jgi:hypothetical protein